MRQRLTLVQNSHLQVRNLFKVSHLCVLATSLVQRAMAIVTPGTMLHLHIDRFSNQQILGFSVLNNAYLALPGRYNMQQERKLQQIEAKIRRIGFTTQKSSSDINKSAQYKCLLTSRSGRCGGWLPRCCSPLAQQSLWACASLPTAALPLAHHCHRQTWLCHCCWGQQKLLMSVLLPFKLKL